MLCKHSSYSAVFHWSHWFINNLFLAKHRSGFEATLRCRVDSSTEVSPPCTWCKGTVLVEIRKPHVSATGNRALCENAQFCITHCRGYFLAYIPVETDTLFIDYKGINGLVHLKIFWQISEPTSGLEVWSSRKINKVFRKSWIPRRLHDISGTPRLMQNLSG